ncbi:MAG TPA: hypothetical protein VNE39_09775 [Planctomycetota bacterium]|nr:hypothetical protein [Planctomycetota bacterium]
MRKRSPAETTPRRRVEMVLRQEVPDKTPLTMYQGMVPQCVVERQLRNDGLCIVHRCGVVNTTRPNVTTESRRYTEDGKERVRTLIHTPVGDLTSLDQPAGFTSWKLERLFKRPEDYRPLLFLVNDQRHEPAYEAFAEAEAMLGEDFILRAGIGLTPLHEIMIHWMGHEAFAVEWAERRDEVLRLYDAMVEQQRRIYPLVAASPALHANYGGNEVPEVMGKERFERYVVPLYNEAAEVFHRHGKLVGAHLDGNNRLWAKAVAGSGLDYVEAFTPSPDTDMSATDALAAWPGKVLWINFPSSLHLASIEKIEATTRQVLREAAPGNRLIIGITEDIPDGRWQANMLAISRVIDEEARGRKR